MSRGRKPSRELNYRDKKIVERYNSTSDRMPRLAKKYAISKQRVYEILQRAKKLGYVIKRKKLLLRHHNFHQCEVCNKIFRIAEKDNLITRRQLAQMLGVEVETCIWHLTQLKGSGFIAKGFATIRSDRLVKALQCYKEDTLSPAAVGRKFGYKNFHSILIYQKKKGLNVKRVLKSTIVPNIKQEEQIPIFPSMSQTEF